MRNVSNGIKIAFFPKNRLRASPPDPVWNTFELHKFIQRIYRFRYFCYLTFCLNPPLWAKSWLSAKTRLRLLTFHFTISLSHKKFLFWKILMTSLHVICSCPPNKNSGYTTALMNSWLVWLTVIMILYQKTAFKQAKINLCHLFIYLFF